jgi:hypothetical protein
VFVVGCGATDEGVEDLVGHVEGYAPFVVADRELIFADGPSVLKMSKGGGPAVEIAMGSSARPRR